MAENLEGVAVVTGANRGIGLAIVRALCKKFKGRVILTSRNKEKGRAAVSLLKGEGLNPIYEQLDILSHAQVEEFKSRVEKTFGGIDILVNNAGVAYKKAAPDPLLEKAQLTLRTNFFASLSVTNAFLPLMRSGGRICMVSSRLGNLNYLSEDKNHPLRQTLIDPSHTEESIVALMHEYLNAVGKDDYSIWPKDKAYSMSKVGLTAVTRAIGRKLSTDPRGILINACCPGYVITEMTGNKGYLTPDQGAEVPLMLCFLPADSTNGEFYMEHKLYDWVQSDLPL